MNIAIIQARMNSNRLPGKVMMDLCGKPVLAHIVERVWAADNIDTVWVATGSNLANDPIIDWCKQNGTNCYYGQPENVLCRYRDLVKDKHYEPEDRIVRITGDCPLTDPMVIDLVMREMKAGDDYIGNQRTYIDGYDVEAFTVKLCHFMADRYKFDEHVTLKYKQEYAKELKFVDDVKDYSKLHLSLDTLDDYNTITRIYNNLYKDDPLFGYDKVKEYLGV